MKAKHKLNKPPKQKSNQEKIRLILIPALLLLLIKIGYMLSFMYTGTQVPLNSMVNKLLSSDVSAKEGGTEKSESPGAEEPKTEKQGSADNATKKSENSEDMTWSYELVQALKQRETDLNLKEMALGKEEERLKELKLDLENKIKNLAQLEKKIADLIATKRSVEEEKLVKLAKVFEETPPEQAGPLLSKLDVDIAAQLLLKMAGKKAGKIWGYVDPAQAVAISGAIAKINPNFDLNKISGKQ